MEQKITIQPCTQLVDNKVKFLHACSLMLSNEHHDQLLEFIKTEKFPWMKELCLAYLISSPYNENVLNAFATYIQDLNSKFTYNVKYWNLFVEFYEETIRKVIGESSSLIDFLLDSDAYDKLTYIDTQINFSGLSKKTLKRLINEDSYMGTITILKLHPELFDSSIMKQIVHHTDILESILPYIKFEFDK